MKTIYLECSCSDFNCAVRLAHFEDDKEYLYLDTHIRSHGFFKRLWNGVRYILGLPILQSETVLTQDKVKTLRNACNEFLDYEFVSEKSKYIFDWLVKYDKTFAGNRENIISYLIEQGAEKVYVDGLSKAEPLPEEIVDFVKEYSCMED